VKKTIEILILSGLLSFSSYCNASLVYSFQGVISDLFHDGAGIIASEGYEIGDQVYATFYVDFQQDGYYLLNNGDVLVPESPSLTNNPYWYFYSSLIEATLLPEMNGGFYNAPDDINEYHIGYYNSGPIGNTGALIGGTSDSYFQVRKSAYIDTRVENWVVGEKLKGVIASNSDADSSIMWADLELTEISSIPTPIPGTALLLSSGLLYLVSFKRKSKG